MDYGYGYGVDAGSAVATGVGAVLGFIAIVYILALATGIFTIICNWKVYKKAGKQGWETIVPIYNIIVLLEIVNLPMWYILLFLVPFANIYATFKIYIELAKKFGQSVGFGIGLVFLNPIFMAILAFNKNYVYQGAVSMNNGQMQQPMYNNGPVQPQQQMYNEPQVSQQPIQSSNCSSCGAPINPGDKFCMSCGKQL